MRKMLVVAVREYQAAVRTKAFLVTLVAMPILMGGSIAVQLFLEDKVDTADRRIAVVDKTGAISEALIEAAARRNETDIFSGGEDDRSQIRPRFLVESVNASSENVDQQRLELSERIRDGELFAFAIIPAGVLTPDEDGTAPAIDYHSNSPTYRDLRRWLGRVVGAEVRRLRLDRAGLDPEVVKRATHPIDVTDLGLVAQDETGQISKAEKTNRAVSFGVPVGMMMLMLMVVMVGASPLVNSVLEEKMQRIAEVLLGSIPPFQLMMGKLLGTVGVSLTLATVYLVGAYAALCYAGYGSIFPTHLIWWFVLYQSLAVLMYGSIFIAVGAAVSDIKESQSMLMPVMIFVMSPFFVWTAVLKAPTAPFSVAVSLFPPATPMLMLLRQAIPPGVPFWQPALGVVLVLLTTAAFVYIAGRIFRVGILMQGKGAKVRDMLRWATRG